MQQDLKTEVLCDVISRLSNALLTSTNIQLRLMTAGFYKTL